MSNTLDTVRAYVLDEVAIDRSADAVRHDTLLIEEEILDSLAIIEMVTFLEDTFGIAVEPEDISVENFRTLESIVALVENKRAGKGSGA